MRIARRDISPVEVIDAALARLAETEPALNAFTAVDADGARRAALAAEAAVTRGDALGPLHGVPVSVKDLIDVAGLPASYGSLIMKDNVARADAPSVERLRRSGAIILGKTATSEFGYQGITKSLIHGTTRNPWNLALTPGGSSGGAAASVAAGVTRKDMPYDNAALTPVAQVASASMLIDAAGFPGTVLKSLAGHSMP